MNLKLFLGLLCNCIFCYAQTTTLLTYDANGNRTSKHVKGSSPHPTVTASPEAVNPNQPCTLTASGCTGGSIQWFPSSNSAANPLTVTLAATTQYEARCIVGGCANNGFVKTTVTVIQCPTASISVASYPENTVRYGQPMTLFAYGCNNGNIVEWSSGNIGSPTNIIMYGSSQIFTATCKTQYCPNLGSATLIVGGVSGCLTGDVLITKQPGNWNDVNTWACGRIPTINDEVYLNHEVQVNANGNTKGIILGSGFLNYPNSSFITVPQN
jgi:hypothetical protein